MSHAMFCATHGPQATSPCPECGAFHTDPNPDSDVDVESKVIDLMGELRKSLKGERIDRLDDGVRRFVDGVLSEIREEQRDGRRP